MAIENPWTCDMTELRREAFAPPVQPDIPPELQQIKKTFDEFRAAHSDFRNTPENVNALVSNIAFNRIPTAEDFRLAHATAIYDKRYQPGPQVDTNPQTMPLDELRRVANGQAQIVEQEPTLQQLHSQAFGPDQSQPDAAWGMDMQELKKSAGLEG